MASHLISIDNKRDFVIAEFGSRNTVQFQASKLKQIFAQNGIDVAISPSVVTIYKMVDFDMPTIKTLLRKRFQEFHPTIKISKITIKPQSSTDVSGLKIVDIVISENSLRREKGSFQVWFGDDERSIKRVFFAYELEATLEVFMAKTELSRAVVVSDDNTLLATIPFDKTVDKVLAKEKLGKVASKSRIQKGEVIFASKVSDIPDIRRNSKIRVEMIESGIRLTFLATATKDAQIGEIFDVKDSKNRLFQVRLISKELARVE